MTDEKPTFMDWVIDHPGTCVLIIMAVLIVLCGIMGAIVAAEGDNLLRGIGHSAKLIQEGYQKP